MFWARRDSKSNSKVYLAGVRPVLIWSSKSRFGRFDPRVFYLTFSQRRNDARIHQINSVQKHAEEIVTEWVGRFQCNFLGQFGRFLGRLGLSQTLGWIDLPLGKRPGSIT
jgi:hypothetical protein